MNYSQETAANWLTKTSFALPNLDKILSKATSEILIIGAGVFDIYHEQGWIPAFKRKTGDLDLSVGLTSGKADYDVLKNALLESKYTDSDPDRKYRFFSKTRVPGGLTYVDLLAHPSSTTSAEATKTIIGVGPDFSFDGFDFAKQGSFPIKGNIIFPNPIGMLRLKQAAYLDNPELRVKDLADIAELSWGIVEQGTHFELSEIWDKVKDHKDAKEVKNMLYFLGSGESPTWDLDNARQELLKRNFNSSEIDELIPERISEWATFLP